MNPKYSGQSIGGNKRRSILYIKVLHCTVVLCGLGDTRRKCCDGIKQQWTAVCNMSYDSGWNSCQRTQHSSRQRETDQKWLSCFYRVEIYNCQYTYNLPCNSVLSSLFTVRRHTLFCLMPKLTIGWAMKPEELSASCLCPFVTSHRAVCLRPYSLKVKVAMAEIMKCCQWMFSGLWNVLNIGLRSCRPLMIPQYVHLQSYTFSINWNLSNLKLGNFRVICPFSFIGLTSIKFRVRLQSSPCVSDGLEAGVAPPPQSWW